MRQSEKSNNRTSLNNEYDSIIQKARQLNLNSDDITLLMLSQAGFTNAQIEVLMNQSYSSVSSRKYRIKQKLIAAGIIS